MLSSCTSEVWDVDMATGAKTFIVDENNNALHCIALLMQVEQK